MRPERWRQIETIFQSALEKSADIRVAFVDEACGADVELQREVGKLLESFASSGAFLETPAIDSLGLSTRHPGFMPGHHIAQYEIVRVLGIGGMGEVYLARDERLGRQIALKILPRHFSAELEYVQRFAREAQAASALNHPNIVTIHEIGDEQGIHYMATEFIEGETLRDLLRHGAVPLMTAVELIEQIASALCAAHHAGLVHRDIKPENVMRRPDGLVKVLDFGLARLVPTQEDLPINIPSAISWQTELGALQGTMAYLSPEQVARAAVDHRTDLFSLGVLFFELLTGKRPFQGDTPADLFDAIVHQNPDMSSLPSDVSADVSATLGRALQKAPERRFQTAAEFRDALQQPLLTRGKDEPVQPAWSRRRRWLQISTLAAMLVAGLYIFYSGSARIAETSPSGEQPFQSVAVLPFSSSGTDAQVPRAGIALSDTLVTKLSNLHRIEVRPLGTVGEDDEFPHPDPIAVGREMRVDAVLVGHIDAHSRDRLCTAQLLRVSDGRLLWRGTIRDDPSDVFALPNALAQQISEVLTLDLNEIERERLSRRHTDSLEAYEAYVKGRYYWNQRSTKGAPKAIECYQEAIDADPLYALAYAGLAEAYAVLNLYAHSKLQDAFPRARAAAEKALELDPQLTEAYATLAYVTMAYDWQWERAEEEFLHAIELNPNYATAHQWYGEYLNYMERFDESIRELRRAKELDPLSIIIDAVQASPHLFRRNYERARQECLRSLRFHPESRIALYTLGTSLEQLGRTDEALEVYSRLHPGVETTAHAYVYAMSGEAERAKSILHRLKSQDPTRNAPVKSDAYNLAQVHAALGESDAAMEYLQSACAIRDDRIVMLRVDPKFDTLRSDSRFETLLKSLGLKE